MSGTFRRSKTPALLGWRVPDTFFWAKPQPVPFFHKLNVSTYIVGSTTSTLPRTEDSHQKLILILDTPAFVCEDFSSTTCPLPAALLTRGSDMRGSWRLPQVICAVPWLSCLRIEQSPGLSNHFDERMEPCQRRRLGRRIVYPGGVCV